MVLTFFTGYWSYYLCVLQLPSDLSQSVDARDVLHGRIKSVAIIYDDPCTESQTDPSTSSTQKSASLLAPPPRCIGPLWTQLQDKEIEPPNSATFGTAGRSLFRHPAIESHLILHSGQSQLRFMELMSMNKGMTKDDSLTQKISWDEVLNVYMIYLDKGLLKKGY